MFVAKQAKVLTNLISVCALILAAAAFVNSYLPETPIAFGAQMQQGSPNNGVTPSGEQPVETAAVNAALQRTFNYQGILRNPDGTLAADGEYAITFSIYDAVIGGAPLHTEVKTNVLVRDGIFNVVLGDETAIGSNVFANMPRYLGIAVAPDAEMQPRQRIHPVPWALMAETLPDGAITAGDLTINGNLNVASGIASTGAVISNNGYFMAINPDNPTAAVQLDFRNNVARIRVSGDQNGDTDGFDIQTISHRSLLRLHDDGTILVGGVKPIRIIRMANVGNNANLTTGISSNEYYCVATGWSAAYDIDENDSHINMIWTYRSTADNTWWLRAHLSSGGGEDENPDVDVVCFRTGIASWEGGSTSLNDPN